MYKQEINGLQLMVYWIFVLFLGECIHNINVEMYKSVSLNKITPLCLINVNLILINYSFRAYELKTIAEVCQEIIMWIKCILSRHSLNGSMSSINHVIQFGNIYIP